MTDSTQLADQYLINTSNSLDLENRYSKGKKMVYAIDLNQGSYSSGQVIQDPSNQLTGTQGFCSERDGYLVVPMTATMKNLGAQDTGAAANGFSIGWKCNSANIIDRIQVEIDNKTLITPNFYLNMCNNLMAMTTWSLDDVQKYGTGSYMIPDDVYSIGYSGLATGTNGDGFSNNSNNPNGTVSSAGTTTTYPINSGLLRRQFLSASTDVGSGNENGWPTLTATNDASILQMQGKNQFKAGAATAGTVMGTWFTMLKLRLIDIHPIFRELDLCQNPRIKITFWINTGSAILNIGGNAAPRVSLASVNMTQGNTCPIIVASAASGNTNNTTLQSTSGTTVGLSWGVLGSDMYFSNTGTPINTYFPFSTTRLYLPFYDLLPEVERSIIESPLKTSHYLDFYTQSFKGSQSAAGIRQNFTLQVSANLKNIKWIGLLPFNNTALSVAAATAAGSGVGYYATAANVDQYASPFDSAPWTCQPGSAIINYNVQVGNSWAYNNNVSYDWQSFLDEFAKLNALNGGLTHALSNGLIDEYKWAWGQRFMLTDVSRLTHPDIPSSVLIQGTNQCDQPTDFIVIIAYEKSLTRNRITGEVVSYT